MTLRFKGRDRHLKCSQYALEVFTAHIDYEQGPATSAIYATIYALLKGGAYLNREEVDFTFEEVCDWCDENLDNAELISACEMWAESFQYRRFIEKMEEIVGVEKKSP